jgi:Trehalose utilization protein
MVNSKRMHRKLWICPLAALTILALLSLPATRVSAKQKIRVLIWSEHTEPADVYPDGINGQFVQFLSAEKDIEAKAANLSDPEQGLSEDALKNTDVLIWFGHKKHAEVTQEHVDLVKRYIREHGLGYLPIHSAHYAKPFQQILQDIATQRGKPLEGTPGHWGKVTNAGKPELIHVLAPAHPILKGVKDFTIPQTEMYANPFNVPEPDLKLLEGRYEDGPQDGSDGLLYSYGRGKMFYFRPGHETYPIYFQKEVQQILKNAVRFLADAKASAAKP